MKRLLCFTLMLLLTAALLSGCGKDKGGTDLPKEEDKLKTTPLSSEDGTFTVDAPEGWALKSGEVLTGAAMELAIGESGSEDAFAVVLRERKPVDDAGAATLTLAEYSDKVIGRMTDESRLIDASTSEPKTIKLGAEEGASGKDAILTEIDGTTPDSAGGIPFHYWVYCVDDGTDYTQLVGWTSRSRLEAYAQTIPALLESFH